MPRYFFDFHDDVPRRDDVGTECVDLDEVRDQVLRTLPSIASDSIPKGDDRRTFTCLVTDENGRGVYTATVIYAGLWLRR